MNEKCGRALHPLHPLHPLHDIDDVNSAKWCDVFDSRLICNRRIILHSATGAKRVSTPAKSTVISRRTQYNFNAERIGWVRARFQRHNQM